MTLSLLDKVRSASGADRELDCEIAVSVDGYVHEKRGRDAKAWFYPVNSKNAWDRRDVLSLPRYTSSVDACLALVERKLPGWAIATKALRKLKS